MEGRHMSKIVEEVIAANKKYVSILVPRKTWHSRRREDSRYSPVWMRDLIPPNMPDPAKYAGLSEGDAHVIRNAGGRASDDAIRSLVISHKLLGTREWFVIHHTNCGMELFTDDVIGDLLADNLETAHFDGKVWSNPKHGHGSSSGEFVKWHTIRDQPSSVVHDVRRIREHPLVVKHIPIYGYIYDVHSGSLVEVKEMRLVDHVRSVVN